MVIQSGIIYRPNKRSYSPSNLKNVALVRLHKDGLRTSGPISACNLYEQLQREAAAIKIQKKVQMLHCQGILFDVAAFCYNSADCLAKMHGHKEYVYYRNLQKAAIFTQCCWKRTVARRELRHLRMKEAKDKLDKIVEGLIWRVQFEKRLRTELEETKAPEIAKLQDVLHSMHIQVEDANAREIKEREAACIAVEEAPPIIKETLVMVQDMAKIDALTAEVES
ncbi:hypothetical protein OROGR_029735 [Orobanche gracilis]